MTDAAPTDADHGVPWDDPVTLPFWIAANQHRLVLQRCPACGRFQFYPRPFCIACSADGLEWVDVAGTGVVYSKTRVHVQVLPELVPPYVVALVDLDEGPRLMGNLLDDCAIGDAVRVEWRDRSGLPPRPVFVSAL